MSTQDEKADRIRAEMQMIGRLRRSGTDTAIYACPLCGGEVSVIATLRDTHGRIVETSGACSTQGCMEWSE